MKATFSTVRSLAVGPDLAVPLPACQPPGTPNDGERALKEFVQLYTSHEVRLRSLALSMFPNLDDANDILQETSLVLWEKFNSFASGSNFFAWAATIMQFKAKEFRRKHARIKLRFSEVVLDQLTAEATGLSEMMIERERVLHDCISLVAAKQLTLLRLRYEKGSSIKSVADTLGRTEGSVRQALARIRKFLSDCVTRRLAVEARS